MVGSSRVTILNVDDHDPGRYVVSRLLRQAGFEVREASTGQEALRLAAESPDLVILDVNLPDMDGFEVCRRIRADPATASLTVLHLSATYIESHDKARGLEAGADGYLTGDVEPSELLATVKALLRMRQAEREARRSARQQAAVADLGQRALEGADIGRLVDEAVAVVARTLEVECCAVLERMPDGGLRLRAGVGWGDGYVGRATVEAGAGSQAEYTLETQQTVVVEDWDTETRFGRPPLLCDHGVRSGMTVVVNRADRPFGVLGAYSTRRRAFTDDEAHFLRAIANVLAAAVQRQQAEAELSAIRDELSARLADMTRLHELSLRLSMSPDLEPVLGEVLAAVTTLQDASMGALMLYDPKKPELYTVASVGFTDEYLRLVGRIPAGAGAHGKAVAERRRVIVEDVEADPLFAADRRAARLAGYRAMYGTPLITRGAGILGVIATYFREPHRPSDREIRLVEVYARQAADFIDNARLYSELRDAIRARDLFVARTSHELRTPLTSALGMIRLLRRALAGELKVGEPPGVLVDIASRNLDTMLTFINELLDVSKLTAGQAVLSVEPVDVAGAVADSLAVVSLQAREKGIEVQTRAPAGLRLSADRLKLEQVLVNLLANAIKFTPEGGMVIVEAEAESDAVLIRVRDTGEGIAREHLEAIFEPFFQARQRNTRPRGTGLGLAICRQIVTLHGGRIWAESDGPGRGSVFTVRLPITPPGAA